MNASATLTTPLEPSKWYHLYNRGNNKGTVFFEVDNYYYFLKKFHHHTRHVLHTCCYCLLPNHYHFLVKVKTQEEILSFFKEHYKICPVALIKKITSRIPSLLSLKNIQSDELFSIIDKQNSAIVILAYMDISTWVVSEQLRRAFLAYTKAINNQQQREGSLFRKNFRRKQVDSAYYLLFLVRYIHRNPLTHEVTDDWMNYPYSSYPEITDHKKTWLDRQAILGEFLDLSGFIRFHEEDHIRFTQEYPEIIE